MLILEPVETARTPRDSLRHEPVVWQAHPGEQTIDKAI